MKFRSSRLTCSLLMPAQFIIEAYVINQLYVWRWLLPTNVHSQWKGSAHDTKTKTYLLSGQETRMFVGALSRTNSKTGPAGKHNNAMIEEGYHRIIFVRYTLYTHQIWIGNEKWDASKLPLLGQIVGLKWRFQGNHCRHILFMFQSWNTNFSPNDRGTVFYSSSCISQWWCHFLPRGHDFLLYRCNFRWSIILDSLSRVSFCCSSNSIAKIRSILVGFPA